MKLASLKTISEQAQQASELEDAQRSVSKAVTTLARALSNYTGSVNRFITASSLFHTSTQ